MRSRYGGGAGRPPARQRRRHRRRARQQSLGNVVAGLVLLLSRPFQVGQHITVRSGALAGTYTGLVLSIGLTYVQLDTDEGLILLPNSGVLAAAVGPRSDTPEQH